MGQRNSSLLSDVFEPQPYVTFLARIELFTLHNDVPSKNTRINWYRLLLPVDTNNGSQVLQ
jgi:hypothetical protein